MSFRARLAMLRLAAWAAAAALVPALAAAQSTGDLVVDGQEAPLRCLVVPSRAIEYPPEMITLKQGGVVRVRLTFTGGEERPRAETFFASSERLRELVLDYVGGYRMPCLEHGEARAATQEFQFVPGDGRRVVSGEPRTVADSRKTVNCIRVPDRLPSYPRSALNSDARNRRVLAQLEFTTSAGPPEVEILFDGGKRAFGDVVRAFMAEYRAPCLGAEDLPLVMRQKFEFHVEGERAHLLKDSTLQTFVGSLTDESRRLVRFDFTTMGCPFEVRFVLWRPHATNVVGELERADPNRREFIEWLRTVDLDAPKTLHDELVGDSMTISVPCGVLDLQ